MIKPGKERGSSGLFSVVSYTWYMIRGRGSSIISFARPAASVLFVQSVTFFREKCRKTTTVQQATAAAAAVYDSAVCFRRPNRLNSLPCAQLAGFMRLRSSGRAVVTGVVPSPPRYVPSFLSRIGQAFPLLVDFHRTLPPHALALVAIIIVIFYAHMRQ